MSFYFPLSPFDQEEIDRSNFSLFSFSFLSLPSTSLSKNIYTRQLGVLCLPEFHNRHLFQFLPSSFGSTTAILVPKGDGEVEANPFPFDR